MEKWTKKESEILTKDSLLQDYNIDGWTDILGTGHILKKVLRTCDSDIKPETSDLCTISFDGFTENGFMVECGIDIQIRLGDLEVIHGIELVLALMTVGEKSEVIIRPRFAYGTLGLEPLIPPNERMRYIIELKQISAESPVSEISIEERIRIGSTKKDRGNWWFSRNEFTFAIICYRRALEYYDETDFPSTNDEAILKVIVENKLKIYNNLAAAQMKIKAYDGALISLSNVLKYQPDNMKALWRKAKIYKELGQIEESLVIIREALIIEPDSASFNRELVYVNSIKKEVNVNQKKLFRRMLGHSESKQQKLNLDYKPTKQEGSGQRVPVAGKKSSTFLSKEHDENIENWKWTRILAVTTMTCLIAGVLVAVKSGKI